MSSKRAITLVTAARFVARLGGEAAFFIGVWGMAAYRFQATPYQTALLMAALAVSAMIGSAGAGSLVDRYGPRNVLVGAQFVYVPIAITVTFVTSLEQLIAACALFGLATAPIMTATGSFAPYLAEGETGLERVNALIEGAGAASFVLGPGLGALFARLFGIESVFYLDAVLTTIGVLLVWKVSTPPLRSRQDRHPFREVLDGLRVSYGIPSVRYYVLMGTLVWFSFGAFGALEPLFYRDVVKTGVETIGWMNSLFGAGIALGAWILTRLPAKVMSARMLAVGVAAVGGAASLYIGTTNLAIIALGGFLLGAFIGVVEPLLRTLMQLDSPDEYVGRVMGTSQLHRSGGELVPLAIAPALSAQFGVQAVMMGGGAIAALIALMTFAHASSLDRAGRRQRAAMPFSEAYPKDEPITPIT